MKRFIVALVAFASLSSAVCAQSSMFQRLKRDRSARREQAAARPSADGIVTVGTGQPLGGDAALRIIYYGGMVHGAGKVFRLHVAHRIGTGQAFASYEFVAQPGSVVSVAGVRLEIVDAGESELRFKRAP